MNTAERISNAELEIMKLLWRENRPMSFTEIRVAFQQTSRWDKSTIVTLIRRLADKGVLTAEKRGVLYYTPNISEAEYVRAAEQQMLDKLYGGSAKRFVTALVTGGKLSEADIDELKAYFKMEGGNDA
ncbi:MAG: BlaI/MecI/CopY family transcriptional regulator [Oscillospiraceae bacterium]|jgi:BlaI family penicillinase repressor|nr:BlaI/MecI/CopY family transcriptional regulator [Oscillospiraceae bacterium]